MAKQDTGMYPGAHPTAPGGMSQKALMTELITKHGWSTEDIKKFKALDKWSALIEAVIVERKAREAEAAEDHESEVYANESDVREETAEFRSSTAFDRPEGNVHVVPAGALDDLDDLDDDEDDDDFFVGGPPPKKAEPEPEPVKAVEVVADEAEEAIDDIAQMMAEMASAREEDEERVAAETRAIFLPDPHTLDYSFSGHAGAGPSAAERWMNCTASLGAVRAFLETLSPGQLRGQADAGLAARQGTTAHAVGETELRLALGEITPDEADSILLGLSLEPDETGESYDADMAEHVSMYTDLVRTFINAGRTVHVESRIGAVIPLTHPVVTLVGDETVEDDAYTIVGSADVSVDPTPEEPVLVVGDYKHGEGIDVDVDSNPQIRIYGLGQLQRLYEEGWDLDDIQAIHYYIIQPRLGGVKEWTESVDDLLDWRDNVLSPALTQALGLTPEGPTFAPSDLACQWCPIKGSCAALTEQRVADAAEFFDVVVEAEHTGGPGAFPETGTLDDERLGRLYAQVSGLVSIRDDLKKEVERRLHRGQHVPGFGLVNYSPARSWKSGAEEQVDVMIDNGLLTQEQVDALYPAPTLVSPTKAIVALGKEQQHLLDDLILVPEKRPVVAPEGDRRKKWEGKPPEEMFSALPEDGED